MPYKSTEDLPKQVQVLPEHAQKIFMRVFNSAVYEQKMSEERAFKVAWGAVKNAGYMKRDDKWVRDSGSARRTARYAHESDPSTGANVSEAFSLEEVKPDSPDIPITIIRPGFNKSKQRFYPAEVLKRDCGVFEGVKMFRNHASKEEEKHRPEGNIDNWAGVVRNVTAREDGSVGAIATIIDESFLAKLRRLKEAGLTQHMGVSIRAVAAGAPKKIENQDTLEITAIHAGRSVDFVTYAGAGGQVDESDTFEDESTFEEEEMADNTEIQDRLEKVEGLLQKANEALAAAEKRAEKAELRTNKAEAKAALEGFLANPVCTLPPQAKDRLRQQFAMAESETGMKEAIASEQEYIASLVKAAASGSPVKNLGAPPTPDQSASVKESFKHLLGGDEKLAELATKY